MCHHSIPERKFSDKRSFSKKFLPKNKKNIFWLQNRVLTYSRVNTVLSSSSSQLQCYLKSFDCLWSWVIKLASLANWQPSWSQDKNFGHLPNDREISITFNITNYLHWHNSMWTDFIQETSLLNPLTTVLIQYKGFSKWDKIFSCIYSSKFEKY